MRTFLKYSGNKTRCLKYIVPYLPDNYSCYIEPFVGSGALFLHIQPKKWIINDLNTDLINLFNTIKTHPKKLLFNIKTFVEKNNFQNLDKKEKLLICRKYIEQLPRLQHGIKRASYYLVLKFCAYMGLIIVKGKYKIPGLELKLCDKSIPIYFVSEKYKKLIIQVSNFLNDNQMNIISNEDYKMTFKKAKRDDFMFIDPPYQEDHDYQFNYNKDENLVNFNEDLLTQVKKLDKKGVKWLMTQADTKQVRKLFKDYQIVTFKVYRHASKAFKNELIIKNY